MSTPTEHTSQDDFYAFLVKCSNAYYNSGVPLISDQQFDYFVDLYENTFNTSFSYIGKANNKKVQLPIKMPSLNKVKDAHAIQLFVKTIKRLYPQSSSFLLSSKVDGVSCLLVVHQGTPKLMTRGDGTIGSDISHLLPYLNLPFLSSIPNDCIIRGELVLYRSDVSSGDIPRNVVSGLVNAKTVDETYLRLLHFVGYFIYKADVQLSMKLLGQFGIETPRQLLLETSILKDKMLTDLLHKWDTESAYDIDGLVIQACNVIEEPTTDNPKHAVAFKVQKQKVQTSVKHVEWNPSRYGQLCPRVALEPIQIGGVTISYATAFHAKYVVDNGIGPGAIVSIIRSGDVIPYILSVEKPATSPQLPPEGSFKWISEIHISATNPNSLTSIKVAKLSHFLSTLQVKGVKEATLEKIIAAGYDTIDRLLSLQLDDLLAIPSLTGVKGNCTATCSKIAEAISLARSQLTLEQLLVGSSLFPAFGEKKIKLAMQAIDVPLYLSNRTPISKQDRTKLILSLHNVSIKTLAETFLDNLDMFKEEYKRSIFLEKCLKKESTEKEGTKTSLKTATKPPVVITGFRDSSLKEELERRGYTIGSSVSGKTAAVIVEDHSVVNKKTEEALARNIPIFAASEALKHLI